MQQYLKDYPTSPYATHANFEMGNYYFDKGDTKTAIAWYDKVQIPTLSAEQHEKFNFQYGYALFAHGDKETAQQYLSQVKDSKEYGKKAAYYLGYIAYDADDNTKKVPFVAFCSHGYTEPCSAPKTPVREVLWLRLKQIYIS